MREKADAHDGRDFTARLRQLAGLAEQLTIGNSSSPSAANGRVVFVSSGIATNLFRCPSMGTGWHKDRCDE